MAVPVGKDPFTADVFGPWVETSLLASLTNRRKQMAKIAFYLKGKLSREKSLKQYAWYQWY